MVALAEGRVSLMGAPQLLSEHLIDLTGSEFDQQTLAKNVQVARMHSKWDSEEKVTAKSCPATTTMGVEE